MVVIKKIKLCVNYLNKIDLNIKVKKKVFLKKEKKDN